MMYLRLASLTSTAMTRLFLADPRKFVRQVRQRLNIHVASNRSHSIKSGNHNRTSEADRFFARGELTEALKLSTGKKARRIEEEKNLLSLNYLPHTSTAITQRGQRALDQSSPVRSLHYVTNSLPHTQSGYSLRSHDVLKSIQASGVHVHAVTRLAYPVTVGRLPRHSIESIDGIPYQRLLPWYFPGHLQKRLELASQHLADIAHQDRSSLIHTTTDFRNGLVVSSVAARLSLPWIYEVRGEMEKTWLSRLPKEDQEAAEQSEYYRLTRAQESRMAGSANAVVALSDIAAQQLAERGVPAERITVVPNAVDAGHLTRKYDRHLLRSKLGLPNDVLVGTVTAVVGYEGLDTLIRSLLFLPENFKALIVGDGDARPELEALTTSLKLTNRVIFAGKKPSQDIWQWYGALDAFIVPRKDTPVARTVTPIKPLIALALGIPVVASDLPALREVTGGTAEYTIPDSPEDLARGIRISIGRDGDAGRSFASTRTWAANGKKYAALYERVLDEFYS